MSEITDQFGLYGAIDRAAVEDPNLARIVAADLSAYQHGAGGQEHGAAGWFDRVLPFVQRIAKVPLDDPVFPDDATALANLAEREAPPTWWLGVQRLRAIVLLVKAVPRYGPDRRRDAEDLLVGALRAFAPDDAAHRYLHSLDSSEVTPSAVNVAGDVGLLSPRYVSGPVQRSTLQFIDVEVKCGKEPVPVLSGTFPSDFTVQELLNYLNPLNWPQCSEFWESVEQLVQLPDAVTSRYREIVSVDKHVGHSFSLATALDFAFISLEPTGMAASYRLSANQRRLGGDGEMVIDEGSLVVREDDGQVVVTDTKRFLFAEPIPGPDVAMMAMVMGFDGLAQQMANGCASRGVPPPTTEKDRDVAERPHNNQGTQEPRRGTVHV
jgi:hypothetical protein